MRILSIESRPTALLDYRNAARRGGVENSRLPVLRARVDRLPESLQMIIACSDLQGIAADASGVDKLHGEVLLEQLQASGLLPAREKLGIILPGDFYSAPGADVRGASGDVRSVWHAMLAGSSWVAGVAGNHDTYGNKAEYETFRATPGLHFLDTDVVEIGGVRVAGLSGIIGDPRKPQRCWPEDFSAAVELVVEQQPQLLILHQPPHCGADQRGALELTDQFKALAVNVECTPLVFCGHRAWDPPLAEIGGWQVLNVHARAVMLVAD